MPPITDPNERASRALIRAIDDLTELVTIIADDGDENPDPLSFQVEPDNLFELAFSGVGITTDAGIAGVVRNLRRQLPEISQRIQELFGDLQPGVQIKLVFNVLRRELATPPDALLAAKKGGGATKSATKTAATKTGATKTGATKSGATKSGSKKSSKKNG